MICLLVCSFCKVISNVSSDSHAVSQLRLKWSLMETSCERNFKIKAYHLMDYSIYLWLACFIDFTGSLLNQSISMDYRWINSPRRPVGSFFVQNIQHSTSAHHQQRHVDMSTYTTALPALTQQIRYHSRASQREIGNPQIDTSLSLCFSVCLIFIRHRNISFRSHLMPLLIMYLMMIILTNASFNTNECSNP